MAIKFKEVTEVEPWDKFAQEGTIVRDGKTKEEAASIAREYHEWLEKQNPIVGTCILCERRFKPRKENDDDE